MPWYKGWLETRPRVIFLLLFNGLYFSFLIAVLAKALPSGFAGPDIPPWVTRLIFAEFAFPFFFIYAFLSGSGITTPFVVGSREQSSSKTTLYTLSLPMSRRRLLFVRA